jgi:hypothetical protein
MINKLIATAAAIILVILGGRLLYYGLNSYSPPHRPLLEADFEQAAGADYGQVADNPTYSQGVVVIDYTHGNALYIEELNILLSKVVARNFSYEVVTAPPPDEEDLYTLPEPTTSEELLEKLSYAHTLILPLSRIEYTPEEITAIKRFVQNGGRLLLIGDPTRTVYVEALNSIAGSFGIIYTNDYLYDLQQNDNNYRNTIYTDFQSSPLTQGLGDGDRLIFYSAGSVNAPGHEIILAGDTTHSSRSEGGRALTPAVLTTEGRVLALADLTFLGEPYSNVASNGLFINNIADFITASRREFELADFPYFFNSKVDIAFDTPQTFNSQFADAVRLKTFLEEHDRTVTFTNQITGTADLIFVGRFDQQEVISDYLAAGQITLLGPDESQAVAVGDETLPLAPVSDKAGEDEEPERFLDGRIHIAGVGDLERGGSSLFYLHRAEGRNILLILSASPDTNKAAFDLLLDGGLTDCLVSPTIAACQTEAAEEKLPPTRRSDRIDKILVVGDDDGRERNDAETGLLVYSNVLSDTYDDVDTWTTSEDGSPDLETLQKYDAVIWTTGDYWDDSIGAEDVALLTEYVRAGGNLLLSGASISFDWDHTEFLTKVAHANYLDFAEQSDLELALPDHPIAEDFDEGAVITFTESPSEEVPLPDVVSHTPDARVIFKRGPESDRDGAASVIAYEDKRAKIAYFAFPIYLLPAEEQALLIKNTVNWFSEKGLPLPKEGDYEPYELEETAAEEEAKATKTPPANGKEEETETEE